MHWITLNVYIIEVAFVITSVIICYSYKMLNIFIAFFTIINLLLKVNHIIFTYVRDLELATYLFKDAWVCFLGCFSDVREVVT